MQCPLPTLRVRAHRGGANSRCAFALHNPLHATPDTSTCQPHWTAALPTAVVYEFFINSSADLAGTLGPSNVTASMSNRYAVPFRICASLILFVIVCMCVLCAGRVKHYKDSISGNLLLPAHPTSKIELDLLIRKMHSLQLVTVRAVAPELENNFIVKYKGVAPSTSGQVPLHLSCDCYEFWGDGDVCPCVLVAADHLDVISLETLLSTLAPRRTVGRPRRIFDGNCCKPDAAPSQQPKKRSAEWFLQEIRKQPALYYHRWRTLTPTLSLTPNPNPTTTGGAP